jgi:hypothetical protein
MSGFKDKRLANGSVVSIRYTICSRINYDKWEEGNLSPSP